MTSNISDLHSLDELDFAILSHLREDGRKSFTELANALDVSVGTVRNRYASLVDSKVLQVYGRVNPQQVGFVAYAHILVSVRPSNRIEAILEAFSQYPEVAFLAVTTGEYDIVLDVMCRDSEHLSSLIRERVQMTEGVNFTTTNIYLRVLKTAQPEISQFFLNGNTTSHK
ncbi:MAG: Lrp/AsnC family transcriptional regulator for asnA, asnC and gidA [Cellvibrionaceae bacterium]|jgi:Lrp/AsnC family transcriptional regulator for asnA, asnC and gidA